LRRGDEKNLIGVEDRDWYRQDRNMTLWVNQFGG